MRSRKLVWCAAIAVVVVVLVGTWIVFPGFREHLPGWLGGGGRADQIVVKVRQEPAVFYHDKQGNECLRLSAEAVRGLHVEPVKVEEAVKPRALPPQPGTVNFDNDRLFIIRSRFGGELAEVAMVKDCDAPSAAAPSPKYRPLRYGDKFKQGDLLAVVWSKDLGQAKAALVDAVCSLRLSKSMFERQEAAFYESALSLATFELSKRTFQGDSNAKLNAIRALRMWKLTPEDIDEIEAEASILMDKKKVRSAEDDLKWARVEIRVPKLTYRSDPKDPHKVMDFAPGTELTLVEKNTHLNDMVDPINSPPLFKLADMSRLQIWVQPPEEYLPILRDRLKKGGTLTWKIQFQAFPNAEPLVLDVMQIAPSLDPNLRTPLVIGYLPNLDNKYIVGQFVTATIFVDPEPDTVEVPTTAINEVEGESLVFVQPDPKQHEYELRRVAVVHRFKDNTFVRSKLTDAEKDARFRLTDDSLAALSKDGVPAEVIAKVKVLKDKIFRTRILFNKALNEVLTKKECGDCQDLFYKDAEKERLTQVIRPGEQVVTRGIVEMTAALETLATKARADKLATEK